ncbi:MAG: WhiB family transcriptional regulator [Actinomycetota bacterium]|nr:WhiB family transcriptional regulator [Actinomycetota bacterium]
MTPTPDTSWMPQARCRGTDTNLFHPHRGEDAKAREALAICASCEVRDQCRDYALTLPSHQVQGIWGGTTDAERRKDAPDQVAT